MAYTIQIDSFSAENIRERTELAQSALVAANGLKIVSAQGFTANDIVYVGKLGFEACEKAVVASVDDETTISLVGLLEHAHAAYSDVTGVLGDKIKIYRAPDVDGSVPAPDAFTAIAQREIDPDQPSTYYRDSTGSADYWYCTSYFNETTLDETARTKPHRGDDFGHYAALAPIRKEAGFEKAVQLKDSVVAEQRRQAESEINAALAGAYTVPFAPVPEIIRTLTVQLAAALLQVQAYGNVAPYSTALTAARTLLQAYADGSMTIVDEDGNSQAPSGVSSYPGADEERLFRIGDLY